MNSSRLQARHLSTTNGYCLEKLSPAKPMTILIIRHLPQAKTISNQENLLPKGNFPLKLVRYPKKHPEYLKDLKVKLRPILLSELGLCQNNQYSIRFDQLLTTHSC